MMTENPDYVMTENTDCTLRDSLPYITVAGAAMGLLALGKRFCSKSSKKVWPRDTVILHECGRGPWAPNMSPYVMKLETYLKMANIPYVNNMKGGASRKGKVPWISYNDSDIDDSQFCIEFLNKKFDVDLNKEYSPEQKAVATSFQRLVEDNLHWAMMMDRWKFDTGFAQDVVKKWLNNWGSCLAFKMISSRLMKQAWQQGMGRHNEEEVYHIADTNLKALSDFIGSKPYLLGDAPCEQDAAIFGILAQAVWHADRDNRIAKMVRETYPNLHDYCQRMKKEVWPDWDECITHGYTKEATK